MASSRKSAMHRGTILKTIFRRTNSLIDVIGGHPLFLVWLKPSPLCIKGCAMRHSGLLLHLTVHLLCLITMSDSPHTPPPQPQSLELTNIAPGPHGATPTRAGDNFISSTKLDHTQQEIKSSLWGQIHSNEPEFVRQVIKPHLVDNTLVAAIEQAIGKNTELEAACDLLFQNRVPEKQMYLPMVSTSDILASLF